MLGRLLPPSAAPRYVPIFRANSLSPAIAVRSAVMQIFLVAFVAISLRRLAFLWKQQHGIYFVFLSGVVGI